MTYYDTLELNENASIEVIKMAYKALAKKYHPDTFKGNIENANRRMAEINEAYEILSDPLKKAEYDGILKDVRASATYANGFKENGSSQNFENQSNIKVETPAEKTKFNKSNVAVFGAIALVFLLILFYGFLPLQTDEIKAIQFAKVQTFAEDWVKQDPNIKKVYGWDAKKVEPNIYFVEYGFDLDNAIKNDGYMLYCFEVNIISGRVTAITDSPKLNKKYVDMGYIGE